MTRIPVIVKTLDDIVPMADVDSRLSKDLITTCPLCYGTLFYQVVTQNYEGADMATDTQIYCAICGQLHGGIIQDPFEELKPPESDIPQSSTPNMNKKVDDKDV